MKKSILIILILSLVAILVGCALMNETYCKPVEEVVEADVPLNDTIESVEEIVFSKYEEKLYQYPSSDSNVLVHIAPETYMTRLVDLGNGWSKIIFDGTEGYVLSTDLQVYKPAYMIETNDEMYISVEVASVHNIKSPHKAVGEVEYATKVARVGVMSNQVWSVIRWDNEIVYILSNNLVSEKPVEFTPVNEEVYLTDDTPLYENYKDTSSEALTIPWSPNTVSRISIGDNGWSKILYEDNEYFVESKYLANDLYPIIYEDDTCKITITKEWYEDAWCYAAHLEFTDYARLSTDSANGRYRSREQTSHAAKRLGAVFIVNGDYAIPGNMANSYAIARNGVVVADDIIKSAGVYNNKTGLLMDTLEIGIRNERLSKVVAEGTITDTFQFGAVFLRNGEIVNENPNGTARAQRTFIGTNGNAGDIWVVVSDGRYKDKVSPGLTGYQCAAFLKDKGCIFGLPLDGGGSSTMVFKGYILNTVPTERAVADFLYLK